MKALVFSVLYFVIGCKPTTEVNENNYYQTVVYDQTADTEEVAVGEPLEELGDAPYYTYTGDGKGACDLDGIDPYDPDVALGFGILNLTEEDAEALAAMGYGGGDWYTDYDQLSVEEEVTIDISVTVPGCEEVIVPGVAAEIGRQMGWEAPAVDAETSWRIDLNTTEDTADIGGYDNLRWWSELYGGPIAEYWLYNYALHYLPDTKGRRAAFMTLQTNYWPEDTRVTYNNLEPYNEDMLGRDYGNGWIAMYEGDPLWMECQVGSCNDTRLQECLDSIPVYENSDRLLEETSSCFDWNNIAASYAWETYFGHWDGLGSPHNGYIEELGTEPENSWFALRIAGVDLVNSNWVGVGDVYFYNWSSVYTPCWNDTSPGGCREMFIADLRTLIAKGYDGSMVADLDAVAQTRKDLDLWWWGVDEDWYESEADWLIERPAFVEAALEEALIPCNDWYPIFYGGEVLPCDEDTGGDSSTDTDSDSGMSDTAAYDNGTDAKSSASETGI